MTIRKNVKKILTEIRSTEDMSGEVASKFLIELTAWLPNIGVELVEAEKEYIKKKVEILEQEGMSVAKAEVLAQNTPEYRRFREVQILRTDVVEVMRSLKHRINALKSEWEHT